MSYGSPGHVAKLVPQHANTAGRFDEATVPSLATVETEIAETSALLDIVLAAQGFDVPVTNATAVLMLDLDDKPIVQTLKVDNQFWPTEEFKLTDDGWVRVR